MYVKRLSLRIWDSNNSGSEYPIQTYLCNGHLTILSLEWCTSAFLLALRQNRDRKSRQNGCAVEESERIPRINDQGYELRSQNGQKPVPVSPRPVSKVTARMMNGTLKYVHKITVCFFACRERSEAGTSVIVGFQSSVPGIIG